MATGGRFRKRKRTSCGKPESPKFRLELYGNAVSLDQEDKAMPVAISTARLKPESAPICIQCSKACR